MFGSVISISIDFLLTAGLARLAKTTVLSDSGGSSTTVCTGGGVIKEVSVFSTATFSRSSARRRWRQHTSSAGSGLAVMSRPGGDHAGGFLAVEESAGDAGGGMPALPLAGLGGPIIAPDGSGGKASTTGCRGTCCWTASIGCWITAGCCVCACTIWPGPLLAPVRGPVWTFFGHDCIGQGQVGKGGSMKVGGKGPRPGGEWL